MMQIERIESHPPPDARDYFEWLQREIARAFILPPHVLSDHAAAQQAITDAYRCTELLRREAEHLVMTHCRPRVVIRKD